MTKDESIEEVEESVEDDSKDSDEEVGEEAGDSSVSDTILSVAPVVKSKRSSNLEDIAGGVKVEEPQWDDSDEFNEDEEDKLYDDSDKKPYEKSRDEDSSPQKEEGKNGLYDEKNDEMYSENNNKEGIYDAGEIHSKSYDELIDNRRSGRSMLEIAGFEDKGKQEHRDAHGVVKYKGKMD